jgi:DNA-binding beta-propeller fold protein YncE
LNKEIPGIPVIAEAYGPSYQDYARVSMNTGLPTVLGWDYHVHQRAHSNSDISRRKADLKKLYTTDQETVAAEILRNYHVSLVYVGRVERREYAGGNLLRFKEWSDLLSPVYQNEGTTIFAVNGQYTGAMPMTTIEHVPEVETATEEAAPQSEEGQLRQPRGVAVDSEGNVYVADFGNDRVQKFNSNLEFVSAWGAHGNLPGQFKQPSAIFVGPNDDVYVTDTWNQRIQVFNKNGEYLREWGAAFFGPRGITINDEGQVYIIDTGNHKVRRFGNEGLEQLSWGGPGSELGQLKEPVGITTDADGQVYVCDNGNARVQIFTGDGKLLRDFEVDGWGQKVFSEPHILVTDDGTIWLTVPDKREVRAYDREGNLLETIRGSEDRTGTFQKPMGIALMPGGQELVISDLEGRLVKIPLGDGGQGSGDGSETDSGPS